MMMAEQPKITVQVSTEGASKASSDLSQVGKAGTQAQTNLDKLKESTNRVNAQFEKLKASTTNSSRQLQELIRISSTMSLRLQQIAEQTKKTEQATNGLSDAFTKLKTLFGTYLSIEAIKQFVTLTDGVRKMKAQLENATGSVYQAGKALQELQGISARTGAKLDELTSLFSGMALYKDAVGGTNAEFLQLTENVTKLGIASGRSKEAMAGAMLQFGQALASPKVQAEELNSLIDGMPLVVQAAAKNMGMSYGEFIKAVKDGKVTNKEFFDALLKSTDMANEKFSKMPKTLEMVMNQAKNTFQMMAYRLDETTGFSKTLVNWIEKITSGIAGIEPVVSGVFNFVYHGFKAVTLAGSFTLNTIADTATGIGVMIARVIDGIVQMAMWASKQIDALFRQASQLPLIGGAFKGLTTKGIATSTSGLLQGALNADEQAKGVSKSLFNSMLQSGRRAFSGGMRPSGKPPSFVADIRPKIKPIVEEDKKGKGGKSDAQKEAEAYTKSLDDLKKKANDASVSLDNMKTSLALVQTGDLAGYEAKQKQIEAYEKVNNLLGDYRGKQRAELEQLARTTVAREQEAEAIKKQVEWFERLTKEKQKQAFDASQLDKLEASLKTGGLRGYEEQQRANSIEARRRELLGDITKPTNAQEEQAREQAQYEANLERRREALQKHVTEAQQARDAIGNALRTGFDNFSQYMLNGTMTFKEAMVGMLRSLAVQLLKVYALKLALGFIAPRMTPTIGPAQPSAKIFDVLGSALGGQRAGGGSVSPNTPYVVGESGRELFVPQTAGNIIPNHAIGKQGAGQGVTIVNNMTINTKEGDDTNSIMEAGKALTAMMEIKVREILRTESRQGGMLHRSFA